MSPNEGSLLAEGLSAAALLTLVFLPFFLANWREIRSAWRDVRREVR